MNLFITFDKRSKPDSAAALSNRFFDEVVGSAVRYQNQAITGTGIHWLVTASDARSVKQRIEQVVGGDAAVTVHSRNSIRIYPA